MILPKKKNVEKKRGRGERNILFFEGIEWIRGEKGTLPPP